MDPGGGQIPGGLQEYQAPVPGDDIVLSIDEPLQYDTEEAWPEPSSPPRLKAGWPSSWTPVPVTSWPWPAEHAHGGGARHRARASSPAHLVRAPFERPGSTGGRVRTARLAGDQPVEAPSASAFTNVYEPGSVEKLVTISAALASGAISPTENFEVPGTYDVAGTPSRTRGGTPHCIGRPPISWLIRLTSAPSRSPSVWACRHYFLI